MLPKIIGNASLARELCLTARKFDAREAMDCGFVNRLFDDKVFIKARPASMHLTNIFNYQIF